jgi:hypothetical protein
MHKMSPRLRNQQNNLDTLDSKISHGHPWSHLNCVVAAVVICIAGEEAS